MDTVKLPSVGATRTQRVAMFLLGALFCVGLWQMYGVLLFP